MNKSSKEPYEGANSLLVLGISFVPIGIALTNSHVKPLGISFLLFGATLMIASVVQQSKKK